MTAATYVAFLSNALAIHVAPTCSLEYSYWLRQEPTHYVIVVATADSAPAALWQPEPSALRRQRTDSPRTTMSPSRPLVVWGQLVHLLRVVGEQPSPGQARAVQATFLQWSRGSDCARLPGDALWMAPGDTVLIPDVTLEPDTLPRSFPGPPLPRFEVSWETVTYSPQRMRRAYPGTQVLSLGEFESFYRALPEVNAWQRDPIEATTPLWKWVSSFPTLARRSPALEWIAVVRGELARAREQSSARPPRN